MNSESGRYDLLNGDEDEIENDYRYRKQQHEDETADDWEHTE